MKPTTLPAPITRSDLLDMLLDLADAIDVSFSANGEPNLSPGTYSSKQLKQMARRFLKVARKASVVPTRGEI